MTNHTTHPPRYRIISDDYFHVLDTWCTNDYKIVESYHTYEEAVTGCAAFNALQDQVK